LTPQNSKTTKQQTLVEHHHRLPYIIIKTTKNANAKQIYENKAPPISNNNWDFVAYYF
jgi:hypothetical protein